MFNHYSNSSIISNITIYYGYFAGVYNKHFEDFQTQFEKIHDLYQHDFHETTFSKTINFFWDNSAPICETRPLLNLYDKLSLISDEINKLQQEIKHYLQTKLKYMADILNTAKCNEATAILPEIEEYIENIQKREKNLTKFLKKCNEFKQLIVEQQRNLQLLKTSIPPESHELREAKAYLNFIHTRIHSEEIKDFTPFQLVLEEACLLKQQGKNLAMQSVLINAYNQKIAEQEVVSLSSDIGYVSIKY